jgi:hypothetical protein
MTVNDGDRNWVAGGVKPLESASLARLRAACRRSARSVNVKEMQSEATGSLTGEGHQTRGEADQALAGVMKPNLVRALIQRGALR